MTSGKLNTVTSKAHFKELVNGEDLVCIMFTATWCSPCQSCYPELRRFASAERDVIIATVDADEQTEICQMCKIRAFPTFMFVRKGKQLDFQIGADVKNVIEKTKDLVKQVRKEASA